MNITILHGQKHNGSTRHICNLFVEKIKSENDVVNEFFFLNNHSCVGCFNCIMKVKEYFHHWEENREAVEALEKADLIILESPCYCMGMSGQLKTFLDHLAHFWMPHRPVQKMFSTVGLTISTAAGAGAGKTAKDMAQHLSYWGVSKTYKFSKGVGAMCWEQVKNKEKLEKQIDKTAKKIKKSLKHPKVSFKSKFLFSMMRLSQKANDYNPTDRNYWAENGWLGKDRPWKA